VQLYSFDDDYVRRLREGDRATVDHFVRYFGDLLLIKLRGRLRTMQAVEDVRQEVFVRVFRALRSEQGLRDSRKLGAFVVATCHHVLLESYRSDARTEPLADDYDGVDAGAGVEQALVTGETKVRVRRVLSRLPQKDADILRALFLEETDKDEICRAFGVDRAYLRVLLHRAKERFRAEYVP
jgi:RNA polymerase sigma-70 factor (ECF subfamily)